MKRLLLSLILLILLAGAGGGAVPAFFTTPAPTPRLRLPRRRVRAPPIALGQRGSAGRQEWGRQSVRRPGRPVDGDGPFQRCRGPAGFAAGAQRRSGLGAPGRRVIASGRRCGWRLQGG